MKSDSVNYDIFDYKLPPLTAEEYASAALSILGGIKNEFPEFYDRFKSPSEVLTLSGVRAFDTYYELGKSTPPQRIQELKEFLYKYGIILIEEKQVNSIPGGVQFDDNPYSIIHFDALKRLTNDYKNSEISIPDEDTILDPKSFIIWWFFWKANIMMSKNEVLKDLICNDVWAPHNITFGMLLGYPGEAIVSICIDPDIIGGVEAKIRHARDRNGAQPVYEYAPELKGNKNISVHENLWSAILDEVYARIT